MNLPYQTSEMDSFFEIQPQITTKAISSAYAEMLKDNQLNRRPDYQRNLAWDDDQKSRLIESIMGCCPMPVFLLYCHDADDDFECIDGQNRLTTIKQYIEQTPDDDLFSWRQERRGDDGTVSETHIYYPPATKDVPAVWSTHFEMMGKKRKVKGVTKVYRFMTDKEKKRFDSYELAISNIKTRLTFDQRKEIFNRWQNGSAISQCDSFKNEDYPFCKFVIAKKLERDIVPKLSILLKSELKNWLWDIYRMINVFVQGPGCDLKDVVLASINARTLISAKDATERFDPNFWEGGVTRLEKFLNKMTPLAKERKKVQLSFLLSLAVVWRKMPPHVREILEKEEVLLGFTRTHLESDSALTNTLNNGPHVKEVLQLFPRFEAEIYAAVDTERQKMAPPVTAKEKKKAIPASLKTCVWNQYIGEEHGVGTCVCCGTAKITSRDFEAGHIIPESDGGPTTLENLRPICGQCNRSMGVQNMSAFIKHYFPTMYAEFLKGLDTTQCLI